MKLSIKKPSMPSRPSLKGISFRKNKDEGPTLPVTTTKVPRKGVLGKMGMKKTEKTVLRQPEPESFDEPAPVAVPSKDESVTEEPVVEETPKAPEPAPEPEEAPEEREEESPEEPAEEPIVQKATSEAPEEPAPVEEASVSEEREQPEESQPMSTGFLCGCV